MTPNTHITTAQLLKLAEADVSMPIPAADTATILSILSFLNLSGTFNPRELGLVAGSPIRPGYAYRCGSLEGLDANDTSAEIVALDYVLTRIGSKSVRKLLLNYAIHEIGCGGFENPGFHNL
ncbi:hypothetical protein H9L39_18216 [Fusarium oxysporum f. sp. albedinis]|nr:hypothetical protein H9L39_18216 [Fusarium oxysporum f. sp. albedinis]